MSLYYARLNNAILRTAADPKITTDAGAAGGTFHGIDPLHYRLPAQSGGSAEPYGADRRAMEDAAIYDLASHDELVKLHVRWHLRRLANSPLMQKERPARTTLLRVGGSAAF